MAHLAGILASNTHRAFPVVEQTSSGAEVFKGIILRNHVLSILAKEALFMDEDSPAVLAKAPSLAFEPAGAGGGGGGVTNTEMEAIDVAELVNLDDKMPLNLAAKNEGEKRALLQRCVACVRALVFWRWIGQSPRHTCRQTHPSISFHLTQSPPHRRLQTPEYQHRFVTLAPYIDQSSYRIPPTFSLERGFNLFRAMGLSHIAVVDKDNRVVGILSRKDLTNINIYRKLERLKLQPQPDQHDEERGGGGGGPAGAPGGAGGGGGFTPSSSASAPDLQGQEGEQPRSVGGISRSARAQADVQLQESHGDAIAVAGLDQGILI